MTTSRTQPSVSAPASTTASVGRPVKSPAKNPVVGYLVGQFSKPHGPLGVVAGRIMSKRGSNVERNHWLVDLLDLQADSRVLEIGPGPGVALAAAAAVVTDGSIVGLDHSEVMLRQSARRNRRAVVEGRLSLVEGQAEALPLSLGRFDRVYCMNVWQFWRDQERVVADLAAQLSPAGRLAIGYQPRHPGASDADTDAAARCLIDQLDDVGLVEVERFDLDLSPTAVTVVIGRRAS